MYIQSVDNQNASFKAIKLAKTRNVYKGRATKIELYKLTPEDIPFMEELSKTVNISKILHNIGEFEAQRWQDVFEYAIDSIKQEGANAVLAVSNNKPCGLLSFFKLKKSLYLDAICDIPQKGKRINYTGSTLFYYIFNIAKSLRAKNIKLEAVTNGPIDVISKYKAKGFKEIGFEDGYAQMVCSKYKINEQLNKLSNEIDYKPAKNNEIINLKDLII